MGDTGETGKGGGGWGSESSSCLTCSRLITTSMGMVEVMTKTAVRAPMPAFCVGFGERPLCLLRNTSWPRSYDQKPRPLASTSQSRDA